MSKRDGEKKNECPFCNKNNIKNRIFYEKNNWIAFLDTSIYAKGHTILSAKKIGDVCPNELMENLNREQLATLGIALYKVSQVLKQVYNVNNVLFSSLRGTVRHFHFHLIPLHREDEKRWRKEKLYENGHLFEFLGDVEKQKMEELIKERIERGWDKDKQREERVKLLEKEVLKLKEKIDSLSKS